MSVEVIARGRVPWTSALTAHAVIGAECHELRITDEGGTFRIIDRADADAVVILNVFKKKTRQAPLSVIETC
ncbi:MAG: type II toxin-antitoxin system RelE/ParE family toxin [Nitrospira sp.]|nr:type II toxin-antitoxin system RelE/ParE family toxin [Nitrospira sp.]